MHLKEEGERDPIFINLANVFMNLQQYGVRLQIYLRIRRLLKDTNEK